MSNTAWPWMQTYSGKKFCHLDHLLTDFDIEDIAHALSLQCRFAGHCKFHYSVGQHSILGTKRILETSGLGSETASIAFAFLLHDASEAYMTDIPTPLKALIGRGFGDVDELIQNQIYIYFRSPCFLYTHQVKEVDMRMLATEKRDIMRPCIESWGPLPEPYEERIEPMQPERVEGMFIELFNLLRP